VNLAQDNGAWVGSIIIPGLVLKGTLREIKVQPPNANFAVKGPLGIQMKLRLGANNKWLAILNKPEIVHRQRYRKWDRRKLTTRDETRQWRRNSKVNGKAITKCSVTGDRKFNVPFLFHSNWREAPIMATDQQIRIGGAYSSPLVVNGVVYFGSADRFLYALE